MLDTIPLLEGHNWPTLMFWMNLDGKGQGVLQTLDGVNYYFYRATKD